LDLVYEFHIEPIQVLPMFPVQIGEQDKILGAGTLADSGEGQAQQERGNGPDPGTGEQWQREGHGVLCLIYITSLS